MKIYVASSWRNAHQPRVVEVLRSAGHEVYDFRNPLPGNEGFSWQQADPTYQRGLHVTAERWRRMVDHPIALEGHALDLGAMKWADACVYVLPCGRSASFEAGWFAGQGRKLVVVALEPTEPELMFRDADIVGSLAGMLDALTGPSPETGTAAGQTCGYPTQPFAVPCQRPAGHRAGDHHPFALCSRPVDGGKCALEPWHSGDCELAPVAARTLPVTPRSSPGDRYTKGKRP